MKLAITIAAILLTSILSGQTANATAEQTVRVGVTPTDFEVIRAKLSLNGNNINRTQCPSLRSDVLEGMGRPFVEFVIVCNSVFEAKIADRIELIHNLPHRRRLTDIASGRLDVSSSTIFPEGMKNVVGANQLIVSDAILEINQFEKAIATLPERKDVLSTRTLKDLRKFRAATVKYWLVDMKTLNSMGLKSVVSVSKPDHFSSMLKAGRADFIISEYAVLTRKEWAKGLVMVPGVKVALVSPRVFPVSSARRDIVQAINGYVKNARSGDVDLIKRAFQKSGFIRPEYADWKLLFPQQ